MTYASYVTQPVRSGCSVDVGLPLSLRLDSHWQTARTEAVNERAATFTVVSDMTDGPAPSRIKLQYTS